MPRKKEPPPRGGSPKKRERPRHLPPDHKRPQKPGKAEKPGEPERSRRSLKTPATAPPINIRVASTRRTSMPASVRLIAALFFVFVAVYMGRVIHSGLTPSVAVETVRMGNREAQRSVSGMIVRYEEVVHAPRDGQVFWAVANNERVRGGMLVAGIADVEAVERISHDRRILEEEMQRMNELRHHSAVDPAVQRINGNLQSAMNSSMHYFSTLNLSELNTLFSHLDNFTETRIRMIVADSHGAIGAEISRQHDQVMLQYGMSSTNIYSPNSGIMSNVVDGHENIVTPENMTQLSRQQVAETVDHAAIFSARDVEAEDAVFKIVGNTWYIVVYMPNAMVTGFTQGADRQIFVQNATTGAYEPMTMRIMHIEQFATDSRVVFRSNRFVMDFLNQRNVSIRTTNYVSRGLQISTSAIATQRSIRLPLGHLHGHEGEEDFVYVVSEFGLRQVPVNILEMTAEHVYVLENATGLSVGDVIAPVSILEENFTIAPSAIREQHIVYRANLGYASPTPIVLDSEFSPNDAFTLLDPGTNPNLRQFDIIITEASSVKPGDIIR